MPTEQLGEQLVHWEVAGEARVLYVHGVPNHAAMWRPFLERSGGVAVDLPGFGASGKRGDGDYTLAGLARFVTTFLDHLGWDEGVRICAHDWGAVALLSAIAAPERVERLALIDAIPLLPGHRWHPLARAWQRRGVGELAMGFTTPRVARRLGLVPEELADEAFARFDEGTQRAILRLHRSASEDALAQAGAGLDAVDCPALVVWGERDRIVPPAFAAAYAEALPGAEEPLVVPGAGHWPWLDEPSLIARIADFLLS